MGNTECLIRDELADYRSDDYIRTEFSMVTEIMMVKIRKRRKYNKKGAKTEKGDVVFRDWDGTEESYSVLSSRPGF